MIPYDYRCPHCGKYRKFDPACYEVGDIVYACSFKQVTTKRGTTERLVEYHGRIEDINRPSQALVRRGLKGRGRCYVEQLEDLMPIDIPDEVVIGDDMCTCNNSQQLTTDNNEQDTHKD